MSFDNGPKIVTNGLQLMFDAADRNSYPGSGTTWRDLATNKNATITSGYTFNARNGGCIENTIGYNNSNRINVNSPDSLSISNCTIQVVLQVDSFSNYAGVRAFSYSTSNLLNDVSINSGNGFNQIRMSSDSGANTANTTVTAYNTWHFFSGVRDATNNAIYIRRNAESRITGTTNSSYPTFTANTSFIMAREPTGVQQWAGSIAIVLFYDRALSVTEELQNFNALKSRFGL